MRWGGGGRNEMGGEMRWGGGRNEMGGEMRWG